MYQLERGFAQYHALVSLRLVPLFPVNSVLATFLQFDVQKVAKVVVAEIKEEESARASKEKLMLIVQHSSP